MRCSTFFPASRPSLTHSAGRFRAGSSKWSRSPAASWPSLAYCCLTNPLSASRPSSCRRCSRSSLRSTSAERQCCWSSRTPIWLEGRELGLCAGERPARAGRRLCDAVERRTHPRRLPRRRAGQGYVLTGRPRSDHVRRPRTADEPGLRAAKRRARGRPEGLGESGKFCARLNLFSRLALFFCNWMSPKLATKTAGANSRIYVGPAQTFASVRVGRPPEK